MLIYGVCISDITKFDEEKVLSFLKELKELNPEKYRYFDDVLESQKDALPWELSVVEWLHDFEDNCGYFGVAAFLRDVIEDIEGVDIVCDDPHGIQYLGLFADAPWAFNAKTLTLSAEDYCNILRKYLNKITDDKLEIRWWSVTDDSDY